MKDMVRVYQTARDTGDRLTQKQSISFYDDTEGVENSVINVYDDVQYQEVIGFGGAFTESAAVTLYKLPEEKREKVLQAYFDPQKGHGYTLCRTHMNSCDFSTSNYACVEEKDIELKSFNIDRDKQAMIPMMKMAAKYGMYKLFISPWSPPGWMKSTGKMNCGGRLLPEYYDAWARHYAKFIKAYEAEGIPIWGVTVQNEPKAVQRWDSCVYTAEEEKNFVKEHLGPTLEREGLGYVKIMIWDHNKERVYDRAKVAFQDDEASKYIWGTAFHWYSGDHFEALEAIHNRWPQKGMVFTEGCTVLRQGHGAWTNAESYSHEIIGDLNNYTMGWCDWNLILDEQGGPNHVENYCEAPIIIDTNNGTIEYKPSYYYIGHFSRFITPGSKRISCTRFTDKLECSAFKATNGDIIVVILNRTPEEIQFNMRHDGRIAKGNSLPHSILTLVF